MPASEGRTITPPLSATEAAAGSRTEGDANSPSAPHIHSTSEPAVMTIPSMQNSRSPPAKASASAGMLKWGAIG